MNKGNSKDDQLTLKLLRAIEARSDVSQRHLASQLGIALGLTNSYLKRCTRKGLVKVKEVPANRYLYYLTPKGFTEKSRLTARFLSSSLRFYRQSAESCSELFQCCENNDWSSVVLCGVSDLAEIACTHSTGRTLKVVAIYDQEFGGDRLLGVPVVSQWAQLPQADAYIITGLNDPLSLQRAIVRLLGEEKRVLVPRILGLN